MPGIARSPPSIGRKSRSWPACLSGTGDTESPSGLQCDREGYGSMMSTWSGTAPQAFLSASGDGGHLGLASWVALSGLNQTQDASPG